MVNDTTHGIRVCAALDGPPAEAPRLAARLAASWDEVAEAQALRHRVFAGEMGARLASRRPGLDEDRFDRFCDHLLVRRAESGEVVACSRLLSDVAAVRAGGYYSQTEFDLDAVLALPGRILEVGRTCVAPGYRNGATIAVLWCGLADYVGAHGFDYLIGCASIDVADGGFGAQKLIHRLRRERSSPPELRVKPRRRWAGPAYPRESEELRVPALLKAYMRLGAWVCGEPAWDPAFNCADLFILLETRRLEQRYARHFLGRSAEPLEQHPRAAAPGA